MVEKDFTIRCRVFAVGERVRLNSYGSPKTVEVYESPTDKHGSRVKADGNWYWSSDLEPIDPQPDKPVPQFERRKVEIEYNWFAPGTKVRVIGCLDEHVVKINIPPTSDDVSRVTFVDGGWYASERLELVPEPEITDAERVAAMKHKDYQGIFGCTKDRYVCYANPTNERTESYATDIEALDAFVRVLRSRKDADK